MRKTDLADFESRMGPAAVAKPLTDTLGLADFALNYYELAPSDSFAFGYHAHENQEEVFYILSGTVTFETEDGQVEVSAGEFIRFAPGEYQRGVNKGSERVKALAMGAPQEAGETDILRHCDSCQTETSQEIELTEDNDAVICRCTECGTITGRYE
ncbi:MAG: cupin domain-containing protein [Halobacteriaceae archaeon]